MADSVPIPHEMIYENVITTDEYRKNEPYIVLNEAGQSSATITFDMERENDILLWLNHCRTNCDGVVTISVNGTLLIEEYEEAKWDNFAWDVFRIRKEMVDEGRNVINILLHEDYLGVYWLSDVELNLVK